MKRFIDSADPFYCSPEAGCRSPSCPGRPGGHPLNHGIGTDEWYFTVACEALATTLSVYGVQLHERVPRDHPARALDLMREPRGKVLATCVPAGPEDTENVRSEGCEFLGVPCVPGDSGGFLYGFTLWNGIGVGTPDTVQPESFWEALELVHRVDCESCESSDEDEEAERKLYVSRFC